MLCTRKSEVNSSSTTSSTDALRDVASTPMRGDQGEPDHQGGGGRAGTPRVAQRVLAGQATGRAEEPAEQACGTATRTGWPITELIAAAVRIQITAAMPIQSASGPGPPTTPMTAKHDADGHAARRR